MHKVLIIDDEKDICFLISEILKDENYNTSIALNSDEAISKFNEIKPDLVILDVWLSNSKLDGIEILKEFKSIDSNIPIIIISGHGTVDLAVKSIKNGAYDFLEKPFNSDKLIILTKRAIESSSLLSENKNLKDTLIKTIPLIGNSEFIKKINKDNSLNLKIESGKFEKGENKILDSLKWKKGISNDIKSEKNQIIIVHIESILPPSTKSLSEVKGKVISEYQNELDKNWIKDLRQKYKYSVNYDVLYSIINK